MGMRFRKSIKIAPGVKLNLGKKSAGISIGNKYGGVSINSRTGTRARISAPGTGLSYTTSLNGGKKRSANHKPSAAHSATANVSEVNNVSVPSAAPLREQLKKTQSNLKVVTVLYPILIAVFIIAGVSAGSPFCYIIAVVLAFFRIKLRRRYLEEIPDLAQKADALDQVQTELQSLYQAEEELSNAKDAAIFFLNYDRILEASMAIQRKAPCLSTFTTEEEGKANLIESVSGKLSELMKAEFEKTYKHLFQLKTQKGIISSIDRFRAPYEANRDKMTEELLRLYDDYVVKLQGVEIPQQTT